MDMKTIMNERGEITTSKILITVIFVSIIVYFCIKLGPMYFKYEMMQLEVKSAIDNADTNDIKEMRNLLTAKIREWNLDLDREQLAEQLIIEREDGFVRIILWWEVDKVFFGKWEKNFYFDIEETDEY